MSVAAPTWLMISAFVLQCSITLGRWALVNDTPADGLINRASSFSAVCVLAALVDTDLAIDGYPSKVFLVCGALALANVYGLAELFDGADPATVRRRQWIYDGFAVSTAAPLALGDGLGPPATWWGTTLWIVFQLPMAAAGVRTVRACLRELPRTRSPLERIAYSALLVTAAYWCGAALVVAVAAVLDGVAFPTRWTVTSCLAYLFVAVLTAIPLARAASAYSGLDRTGRELRALRPLWRDLTTAVPEVVLPPSAGRIAEPDSRLYRMVVETRDALQHLRMYMPRHDSGEPSIAAYARHVASAVDAKASGRAPSAGVAGEYPYAGQDLAAELGHLLELARAWPAVVSVPARANRR
ncbi:MAB_1171c family putative transporter [Nocardia amikacinitolerans]|uniref:MAB_1171c family putative transporter n=1 Tax=Nocardia amikacinitolerans TaxID=756689 RepID=UPI00368286A9